MPSNQTNVNIGVKYNVDQASVNAVKKSLQDLQNIKPADFNGSKKQLTLVKEVAEKVLIALKNAFNVNLNSLNVSSFNLQLHSLGLNIDTIYQHFSKAGAQGQVAFSQMASSVLTTNLLLKETKSLITSMGETMANTVKWGIASSVMNSFTNSVKQAFQYAQSLDSALTDIRIVTGDSTLQMRQFAQEANKAAQSLGRSTMDYTKAALTFYQQGLSDELVQTRTLTVLKAQNITGAGLEMADYLTAVWNGYKVANLEAELYVDKLAAVADSSASNMSLLAVAMSKVASTANALGVPVDSLNAQIATITATTRQAPETVGNALKTIYARINDIATGADDAEVSLGNYTKQMVQLGFNVLDADGKLKDTGVTLELIGEKWSTLSRLQQIYLARTMAGQRQYNNLIALFDNWSKYTDLVTVSMESQGATMEKNSRYMDSMAAKLEQLGATSERLKDSLIDELDLKSIITFGNDILSVFTTLIESIGGGKTALLALGSIFTQIFSGTIAKELNNIVTHFQTVRDNTERLNADINNIQVYMQSKGYNSGLIKLMVDAKTAAKEYYDYMSSAQINEHNQLVKNIADAKLSLLLINERKDAALKFAKSFAMSQTAKGQGLSGSNINEKILSEDFQLLSGTALLTVEALQDKINLLNFQTPKDGLDSLKLSFDLLKNDVGLAPLKQLAGFDEYQNALNAIKDQAAPTNTEVRRVKIALQNLLEQANQRISDAGALKQLNDQAKIAEDRLTFATKASLRYLLNIKQFSTIKTFVNMAAGIGQVSSALMSLNNITKIWENDTLSAGEKVLQTFSSIGMSIGMLVNGLSQMKDGFTLIVGRILNLTAATGAYQGMTVQTIASQYGLAAATQTVAASFWAALAPLLPYAIAIAAVGTAVYALYKEWNKLNEAALKAAKVASDAKKVYDDLKATYDNLKSSLLDYNSAQEAISLMTKGTQLWRDAIKESNDAVLLLIKNYPQLADQVLNVNGQLKLSKDAQLSLLDSVTSAVDAARVASVATSAASRDASLVAKARLSSRFVQYERTAELGGFENVAVTTDQMMDVVKAYSESTDKSVLSISALSGVLELAVKAILDNVDNMAELSALLLNNTLATKLAYLTIAALKLQGNSTYLGLDDLGKQVAEAIAGRDLQRETQAIVSLIESRNINRFTQAGDIQDILDRYNTATNQHAIFASNAVTKGGNIHLVIDGKDITYSKLQIAQSIAAAEALKNVGTSADKAALMLSKIDSVLGGDALNGLLAGNGFGDLTQSLIEKLNPYSKLMIDVFNTYAEDAGYLGGKAFQDAFIQTQLLTLKDFEHLLDNSSKAVKESFNSIDVSNATLNMQKEIATNLQDAFNKGGRQGLTNLLDFYKNITDFSGLEEVSSEIDFSTTSTQLLQIALQNAGIATGLTTLQLQAYILTQKKAALIISPELTYKTIHDIINGLKTGDTISSLDAAKLEASGVSLDGYFTHMADGSLKLRTSALLFYEYANNQSLEGFKTQILSLKTSISNQAAFSNESKYSAANDGDFASFSANAYDLDAGGKNIQLLSEQLNFLKAIGVLDKAIADAVEAINSELLVSTVTTLQISELVKQHAGEWQNLESIIKGNVLQLQIYKELLGTANDIPLDADIDEEQWRNLADYLHEYGKLLDGVSLHLLDDMEAAEELAEAMLRYDHALLLVADHYEDWLKALSSGSLQDQVEAGNELQNVYSDLLDLPFESLSPDFTQNIENLHLLQLAAKGSLLAYLELQLRAAQDILAQIGIDTSQFEIDKNQIYSELEQITGQQWDDILIGANLDSGNVLQSLTDIVNAAGMTAEQATDYLANMGIDAKVTLHSNEATETQEIVGSIPREKNQYIPYDYTFLNGTEVVHQTGHMVVPGYYYEPQYQTVSGSKENKSFTLLVESAHKKSGGAFKFNNASHGGGSKKPSSKGKGGGGGGGGKGKTASPSTKAKTSTVKIDTKSKEANTNPYLQELKSYDRQSKKLDLLQDKLKKLVNKDRLKNLQQQNKVLEKQKEILEKELAISNIDAAENSTANYAKRLAQAFGDAFKLDTDGQIADQNRLLLQNAAQYNRTALAAADAFEKEKALYNDYILNTWNKYATKDLQEAHKALKLRWDLRIKNAELAAKKLISSAEEVYKLNEKLIDLYNKAWELDLKRRELIEKAQQQIYDNMVLISQIKVGLSIDTGDLERDWLKFENKFIKKLDKDDFLGNAKASAKELMSYFNSGLISNINNLITSLQDTIKRLQKMLVGAVDKSTGYDLAKAQERLSELLEMQQDKLMEIQDLVDDIKEKYLDAIDDAKDKMDDQIDQYLRINDLVLHNVKMTLLLFGDKAYDTLDKYYELQQKNNLQELDSLRRQQDYWQKKMDNLVVGSDAWKKFKENLDDTVDQLNSKLEDMIDNLHTKWANKVDGIILKMNNALTGGRGLDYLDQQWDAINNYDDKFLDTFESKTGIDLVERLYQSTIDSMAGSPKAQQKLNQLMNDQMKLLREKDHLTLYDLERAKASLEVEKARLALEEARDNRTKMRLRRDSQGNYTYQYVADEEKLGDLQAALADAQANLYNTDKEHYKQNLNDLYDTYKNYILQMRDLTEEYNNTQDEEERKRIQNRIDLLKKSTSELMEGLTLDNKQLLLYLNESFFDGMNIDTSMLTMELQMEILQSNVPQMQSLIQDLANTIVGLGGILNATADMIKEINAATKLYDEDVKNTLATAGTSVSEIAKAIDSEGLALDRNVQNAKDLVTANDLLIKSCNAQISAMEKMLSYMDQYLNKVLEVLTVIGNLRSSYNSLQNLNGSNLTADKINVADYGLDTTFNMNYTGNPATDAATVKKQIDALMSQYEKFLAQMSIATFDTGGYTGTWGDAEGRLAFLHQNELVLNQEDTRNILEAVYAVRNMTSLLNSIALKEIASITDATGGVLSDLNTTMLLDQNVHIEANFPNVTQHTEIEQAFLNLVNMASMRASRYRD